jgi:hypothetical protein
MNGALSWVEAVVAGEAVVAVVAGAAKVASSPVSALSDGEGPVGSVSKLSASLSSSDEGEASL